MWFSCSGEDSAPSTLQQKDAIESRRVLVHDIREFRTSALDSQQTVTGFRAHRKVNDFRDQITFEKPPGREAVKDVFLKSSLSRYFAQNSELPAVMDSDMLSEFAYQPGPSYLSLILLALTVGLSGSVYVCVLRYICTGCFQPVVVGPEDESMSGVV